MAFILEFAAGYTSRFYVLVHVMHLLVARPRTSNFKQLAQACIYCVLALLDERAVVADLYIDCCNA